MQRISVERNAIVGLLRQNFPKGIKHRVRTRITETQKIEVARASVRIVEPIHHQHRPF